MKDEKKLNWVDLTISFVEKIAENKKLKADVARLEQDSKRLAFLIKQGAAVNVDFDGVYFMIVTNQKNVERVIEDMDAMACIDKALEYAK